MCNQNNKGDNTMTTKHDATEYDYFIYDNITKRQITGPMAKIHAQRLARGNKRYVVYKRLKPSRCIGHPKF